MNEVWCCVLFLSLHCFIFINQNYSSRESSLWQTDLSEQQRRRYPGYISHNALGLCFIRTCLIGLQPCLHTSRWHTHGLREICSLMMSDTTVMSQWCHTIAVFHRLKLTRTRKQICMQIISGAEDSQLLTETLQCFICLQLHYIVLLSPEQMN